MIVLRIATGLFAAFVALPLLWLVYAAFLPAEALLMADLTTLGFTLQNFRDVVGTGLFSSMAVSVVASGTTVLAQLAFGLAAAYAIRNGARVTALVLVLLALPSELLLVPLYRLLQTLSLIDTLGALIVPFLASPLVVFLLLQALRRVAWEVVEAARIDGASEAVILTRVVTPILRPELTAAAVLAFAAHWNLVLFPRVTTTEDLWTVQVFLSNLLRTRPFEWGLLGAAALLASAPILVLYVVFEKRILSTFEAGFRT